MVVVVPCDTDRASFCAMWSGSAQWRGKFTGDADRLCCRLCLLSESVSVCFMSSAENGGVTTYQWRYGEPPLSVEPPPPAVDLSDEPAEGASDEVRAEVQ